MYGETHNGYQWTVCTSVTYPFAGRTVIVNTLAVAATFRDQIEITFNQFLGQVSFHVDIGFGETAVAIPVQTLQGQSADDRATKQTRPQRVAADRK